MEMMFAMSRSIQGIDLDVLKKLKTSSPQEFAKQQAWMRTEIWRELCACFERDEQVMPEGNIIFEWHVAYYKPFMRCLGQFLSKEVNPKKHLNLEFSDLEMVTLTLVVRIRPSVV